MREFEKLAQHLFICAPTVAQHAGARLLFAGQPEDPRTAPARVPAAARLPGARAGARGTARPGTPRGAFYVYAGCPAASDGRRFALELLEREGVAATPGIDFGSNGTSRYVRFAYTRAHGGPGRGRRSG